MTFNVGDLVDLGLTNGGTQQLVMPVVRVTKTTAILQLGERVERIHRMTGKLFDKYSNKRGVIFNGKNYRPLWPEVAENQPTPEAPTAADYDEVLTDHRRLVRELDMLLNGENAAQQASLCDIVAQVRSEKERPAPDVDEYAYDLSRQIMQLVSQTHVGGLTQLQAKIQCLIAETAAPATAPAPVPDWSQAERRDCTSCGSEGVSTLHYNGEAVCYDCWPTEPAPPAVSFFRDGIVAAANWVDESREAFERESGQVDPDTGTFEFKNNADAEYSSVLFDVAEGIRQLHPDAAPAMTEKPFKDVAPNDVVPVGNDFFRVRYITRHGDDTTLHLQREAEKLSPYTQNDVIHLSVANAVSLMTKVKAGQ